MQRRVSSSFFPSVFRPLRDIFRQAPVVNDCDNVGMYVIQINQYVMIFGISQAEQPVLFLDYQYHVRTSALSQHSLLKQKFCSRNLCHYEYQQQCSVLGGRAIQVT